MVSIDTNQMKTAKKKVVAVIGRWMPIHNGHKSFIVRLAREYDKIVVMIGSCYENGTLRYCIPAVEREKMLRAIFKTEHIPEEKFEIVPVPDTEDFEDWLGMILEVCSQYGVTHFCTGNKEDILDVLEKREDKLDLEMINPEEGTDFPYHATDIRKLIIEGKYEEFVNLIPIEIQPILFKYTFKEILAASQDRGLRFVSGRQTVDIVFLIRDSNSSKLYVLLGKRAMKKVDFPGYLGIPGASINKYETVTNAVIRALYEQTGLKLKMVDNSLEPAIVRFENVENTNLEQLSMVGIFSSDDEKKNGTRGGSSQCFGLFIEDEITKFEEKIVNNGELTEVHFYDIHDAIFEGLAYQHKDMIAKAITMFEAYPKLMKNIGVLEFAVNLLLAKKL